MTQEEIEKGFKLLKLDNNQIHLRDNVKNYSQQFKKVSAFEDIKICYSAISRSPR